MTTFGYRSPNWQFIAHLKLHIFQDPEHHAPSFFFFFFFSLSFATTNQLPAAFHTKPSRVPLQHKAEYRYGEMSLALRQAVFPFFICDSLQNAEEP